MRKRKNPDLDASELVFTTDPGKACRCPKCRRLKPECRCEAPVSVRLEEITVRLGVETSGRKGRPVTVLSGLPGHTGFLREWAGRLKSACGCGGTWKKQAETGCIEIQGDKREPIRQILSREGFIVRG